MAAIITPGTSSAAMSTPASTRVSQVFELLELILLSLAEPCEKQADIEHTATGLRTLLLSQRTSRMFRDVIANSPAIQKALFYKKSSRNDTTFTINPLLTIFRKNATMADKYTWRTFLIRVKISNHEHRDIGVPLFNLRRKSRAFGSWRGMYAYGGNFPINRLVVTYTSQKATMVGGLFANPMENQTLSKFTLTLLYGDFIERMWEDVDRY